MNLHDAITVGADMALSSPGNMVHVVEVRDNLGQIDDWEYDALWAESRSQTNNVTRRLSIKAAKTV